MTTAISSSEDFDVVILGGGFAGACQARHLLLTIPGVRVAIVEPRDESEMSGDRKIGESTVEIAALFLAKELGLHDYLIESHPPKYGLNFHWPKDPAKTAGMGEYYSIWTNRSPTIPAFQLHRGKFERDMMVMNREMGVTHILGKAIDLALTKGDERNRVTIKTAAGNVREVHARHLVDASGRKFLVGRRTDNIVRGPETQYGLNNGAAWVRVRNVDRRKFHDGHSSLDTNASRYYGTNHFFGPGHWLWMIPIDMSDDELSVGVMHHHDVVPAGMVNRKDAFYAFLKSNHRVLYDLVSSGEHVDFHYFGRPSHSCKQLLSPDNWYVLGDAAYIFDAFYSLGSSTIAFQIEAVTEVVKSKLAGAPDAEKKRAGFNQAGLWLMRRVGHIYSRHAEQLGHASVMSWRIYYEYIQWYGSFLPIYVGKWHLDLDFIDVLIKHGTNDFSDHIYDLCTELVERNANLGFMDCHRADQLVGNYTTWRAGDDYLENSKFEPGQLNIYRAIAKTYRNTALWYGKFRWRSDGLKGLLSAETSKSLLQLGISSLVMANRGLLHAWNERKRPKNRSVADMRRQFASYRYKSDLQPTESASSSDGPTDITSTSQARQSG